LLEGTSGADAPAGAAHAAEAGAPFIAFLEALKLLGLERLVGVADALQEIDAAG